MITNNNWHNDTIKHLATLSSDSLKFIIQDCKEAASVGLLIDNPKTSQYIDTITYASTELFRRNKATL